MATNSNMGYHQGAIPASAFSCHAISFQSGAINSSAAIIPTASSSGINNSTGIIAPNNSGVMSSSTGVIPTVSSSSGLLVDNIPGLKHDSGLAVDWSLEEQSKLEEGLVKYADEPSIMRYIKIAATLRDKTVRDVALRCRWMTKKENGKRRKQEEHCTGKKLKDRKDKLLDSSSKANILLLPPQLNVAPYPYMTHPTGPSDCLSTEVLPVGSITRHLLEENEQVFSQITANLAAFRIQENIDLFYRAHNNILVILNDLREMPGTMCQTDPLRMPVNEELANTILPNAAQGLMFGGNSSVASCTTQLKQELI